MSWSRPTTEAPYCCNQKAVWIDYGKWLCYWYCTKCKKEVGKNASGNTSGYQSVLDEFSQWTIY